MYFLTNISYRHPLLRKRVTALVKNNNSQELVRAGHSIRLNNEDFSLVKEKSTFNKHPEMWDRNQIFLAEEIKSPEALETPAPVVDSSEGEGVPKDEIEVKDEQVTDIPAVNPESGNTTEDDVNACLTHKALDDLYDKLGIEIEGFSHMKVRDKKEAIISMLHNS